MPSLFKSTPITVIALALRVPPELHTALECVLRGSPLMLERCTPQLVAGDVYPAGAGEMYSMTGTVSEKLATGAGEMFSTT